jgi:hypothetical protein
MTTVLRELPGDGWIDRHELARMIAERGLYRRTRRKRRRRRRLRVGKYGQLFEGNDTRCSKIRLAQT